ncbi:MAG TPA: hypothetical protein VNA25_03850 [Phycisphaerae bacterium]|nr:hypothetical protein [Phycisphaerae bacterium]
MKARRIELLAALAGLLVTGAAAVAQDLAQPDPEEFLQARLANPRMNSTGEGFCWHAAYSAGAYLDAYEAFGNPKWIEAAEKHYDFVVSKLRKDPDGYEGWIGPYLGAGDDIEGDALVGDAILCANLVRFAEVVLGDEKLKARWGAKANKYVELSTRIIWEKWNHRGCYYTDAAGRGSYHTHHKYVDAKTGKWVERPSMVISDNLNKHYSASLVLLRLWRLTGKTEYKDRVKAVYGRAKDMWRYYPDADRVVWNFWMPHGPYDIEGTAPKSWVAVHPSRSGYQAGEVRNIVEVYDSGLVFDANDLRRIIRTNHWMYSNGKWRCADGTSDAGELWTALARFDEKTRTLYEQQLRASRDDGAKIALAYLKNVTAKRLGFGRLYVKDPAKVELVRWPLQPGRNIGMSVVIPDAVETINAAKVKLACQTRAAGTLTVELLDAAGKKVLGELYRAEATKGTEYHAPRWDGTNPATGRKDLGEYRIRWTLAGESRVEPVWVKVGTKRAAAGPEDLKAGERIACDFEGKLDARWKIEGAKLSADQAHGGKKSLKLDQRHQAVLRFGDDDLPVKVSMWVFDAGKQFGKEGVNGPAWGVRTAGGNKFAVRTCWRPYLAGDRDYAWLNTGQNQWFSPHPCRLTRKKGWGLWVFDFTNPKAVKVTLDGKPITTLDAKFTPSGAAAVYLMGGDAKAGALYVDDVTVEYPK